MTYQCKLCGKVFHDIGEPPKTSCPKDKNGKHVFEEVEETSRVGGKKCKRSVLHQKRTIFLVGIIVLLSSFALIIRSCATRQEERKEQFIHIDYVNVIATSVRLPFECRLKGEYNTLEVKLDTIEKVFPYKERVSVVLHGSTLLVDSETGNVREQPEAALRFSFAIAMDDEGFLTLYDPELDSLSVYSDSPDVEAIVQRTTFECWKSFVSSMAPWKLDLTNLPFKPEHDVQVENDGVFVFGKRVRK